MRLRSSALGRLLAAGLASAIAADAGAAPAAASSDQANRTDRSDPSEKKLDSHDLGQGLRYARFADLADEQSAAAALAAPALVLDLRLATADPVAEARLRELLPQRGIARPLFLLLGADTPAALRAAVPAAPGVLTLGSAQAGFPVAVAVSTDLAHDRATVAELAAGRPLRELIEEKLDKPRFDEARLARAHANGRRNDDDSAPPAADAKDKAAAAPEPPLKDLVLQRAVFLHRALLALGRLPPKD